MTDSNLWRVRDWYRRDDDEKDLFEPTFAPEDYVFVKRLAAESYEKLHPRQLGPFLITAIGADVVRIKQD